MTQRDVPLPGRLFQLFDIVEGSDTITFVSYVPTILVVGDPALKSGLTANLAPGSCHVVHCDTAQAALNIASDAAAVILQARAPGTEDFCRRLRADPITASVPLLVRGGSHQATSYADEVLSTDLQQTLDVLYTYLPELLDPSTYESVDDLDDEEDPPEFFDINESTVIWRRPEGVDDWPQPPPEYHEGEDPLDYARGYAGYVNSLVEAGESPGTYSEAQLVRLDEMSHRVVGAMDEVLGTIQNAINGALRAGDLRRMRELSAAKNVLFEKLQRLRTMRNAERKRPAPAPKAAPAPATTEGLSGPTGPLKPSDLARNADPAPTNPLSTGPQVPPVIDGAAALGDTGPQRKSRLTLAAEAKEKERLRVEKERGQAQRAAAKERHASARVAGGGSAFASRTLWLVIVALAVVAGGAVYLLRGGLGSSGAPERTNPHNKAPVMRYVTIQETAQGVIVRPKAEDPEGDSISYAIRWSVDGQVLADAMATTLPRNRYKLGQLVAVEVTPNDPFGGGQPMASQPLKITGNAPAPRRPAPPAPRR